MRDPPPVIVESNESNIMKQMNDVDVYLFYEILNFDHL